MRAPSGREILTVAAGLSLLAVVEFGRHIANGGFYSDDWGNAADYAFAAPPQVLSFAHHVSAGLGGRWGLALALPLPHSLFGLDKSAHIAVGIGLGILTVLAYYAVLRRVGLAFIHAAPIAALTLIFPWGDSVRLWPTASINTLAVLFFFLGILLAMRGLNAGGRRSLAFHASAQTMYAASVITYEAALPAIALSGALYTRVASCSEKAGRRWKADLVLVVALLAALVIYTHRAAPSVLSLVAAPVRFLSGGVTLTGDAVLPLGLPDPIAALVGMALVGLTCAIGWRRRTWLDGEARCWLAAAAVAGAYVVAGHLMFFGTGLLPRAEGTENRGNLLTAYAYVPLAYSLLMFLVVSSRRGHRKRGAPGYAAAAAISALLALGYTVQLQRDIDRWDRANDLQGRALRRIDRALHFELQAGSSVYTFGWPARVSRGVPVFAETWDLAGALRLRFGEDTLSAYPIYDRTRIVCHRRGLYPVAGSSEDGPWEGYDRGEGARYGRAVFVDVDRQRAWRVESSSQCTSLTRQLEPGPTFAPD